MLRFSQRISVAFFFQTFFRLVHGAYDNVSFFFNTKIADYFWISNLADKTPKIETSCELHYRFDPLSNKNLFRTHKQKKNLFTTISAWKIITNEELTAKILSPKLICDEINLFYKNPSQFNQHIMYKNSFGCLIKMAYCIKWFQFEKKISSQMDQIFLRIFKNEIVHVCVLFFNIPKS